MNSDGLPGAKRGILSFAPGPAILPEEVLEEFRDAVLSLPGGNLGILELGHRTDTFDAIVRETVSLCRRLLSIPDSHEVLLLHGGARMQFAMLPANLLPDDRSADYLESGWFSRYAIDEARYYGQVHVAASSADQRFRRLPSGDEVTHSPAAAYVHFTSNNTESGTQFPDEPVTPVGAWLACDASSDLFTRPIDVERYGVLYATTHKNLGTAGLAIVILRRDLLQPVRDLPRYFRYSTHAQAQSRFNTPPVAALYVLCLMLRWIDRSGGVAAMEHNSIAKSSLLYTLIDSNDLYSGLADPGSRSRLNVTFALPSPELEDLMVEEAARAGMHGLRGYRRVGHLRASLFNAVSLAASERLADFMADFASHHRC